jgi:hypothetical protein
LAPSRIATAHAVPKKQNIRKKLLGKPEIVEKVLDNTGSLDEWHGRH